MQGPSGSKDEKRPADKCEQENPVKKKDPVKNNVFWAALASESINFGPKL